MIFKNMWDIFIPQHCTGIPPGWKPPQRTRACPEVEKANYDSSCFDAEQSNGSDKSHNRQTHVYALKHCPVCCAPFSPPTHEAKVNSASKAVLRSLASL